MKHAMKGCTLVPAGNGGEQLLVQGDRLTNGHIKVVSLGSMTERYEPYEAVINAIRAGALAVHREGVPPAAEALRRTDRDDQDLARARRALETIRQFARSARVSFRVAYDIAVATQNEEPDADREPLPSLPTIYRYQQNEAQGRPLIRPTGARGNRTARYSNEVRELVVDLADLYLQPKSRWTLFSLLKAINQMARSRGLLVNRADIGSEYVKKVIYEDITTDVQKARMDPKDAIAAKAVAKNRIVVSIPLQRVEQDALHLPFVVKTPHGISRSVWLVYAIDCATSIHVGWRLVVGSPTVSDSLRCTERILYPKADLLKKLNIQTAIDLYGVPELLVFDNGPENKGERMEALSRLRISPMYCKARAAHGKPFIERSNKSLKVALETLPGCTRFDGVDGGRDPVAAGDELMTLDELELRIVRWFFEKWADRPLERLKSAIFTNNYRGSKPVEVLRQMLADDRMVLPLPPNRQDWLFIQFERATAKLSRKTCATVRTFQFKGNNLERLIKLFGEVEVDILVDPDDFRYVYVPVGPDVELVALRNAAVDDGTPAYSFAQAKELRANLEVTPPSAEAQKFDEDLMSRSMDTPQRAVPRRRVTRADSQATTAKAKHAAAVDRAAVGPRSNDAASAGGDDPPQSTFWKVDPNKTFPTRQMGKG